MHQVLIDAKTLDTPTGTPDMGLVGHTIRCFHSRRNDRLLMGSES